MLLKKEVKSFLKVYLFTWITTFLLFLLNLLNPRISFIDLLESYWQIISSASGQLFLHSIVLVFYCLYLLIRYFIRVYRNKGFKTFIARLTLQFMVPIFLIYYGITSVVESNSKEDFSYSWDYSIENKTDTVQNLYSIDQKHRGMTVYALGRNNRTNIQEIIRNNIEWVVVLPYFYQENEQTNSIRNPKEIGKWSQRDSMFIKSIEQLHQNNIRVHLKPHLWMSSGWRSNINFKNQEDWNNWFESYRKTILHYAAMAEKTKTELFCIGTELRSSIRNQPDLWMQLIKEIKTIYSGKLTYAANWDDQFDVIPFWHELDYIGVQAYFPLTQNSNPNLNEIKEGWDKHIAVLQKLSNKYNKQILFTEVGYRPDRTATKKPWEWGSFFSPLFKRKSTKTQYLAFEALYQKLWIQEWFAGTYIWQWDNSDFEIKDAPAQNCIAKWYSVSD